MISRCSIILVISTPEDLPSYQRLLRDGKQWGLKMSFASQDQPRGLADAFLVGRDFIGKDEAALILGDNIFYGQGMPTTLRKAASIKSGAVIFAYPVRDPERYGVVEFNDKRVAVSIEEKPVKPKSQFAIPGIYFYDNQVVGIASKLKPSKRGELEITDLNRVYLEQGKLQVEVLGRGIAWLDAGTHESLLQAANFVQAVEDRQGMMISCPEEIAYRMGYISKLQLIALIEELGANGYSTHLRTIYLGSGDLI
jgi:glucose-1-phosphate thymidylyltransferase